MRVTLPAHCEWSVWAPHHRRAVRGVTDARFGAECRGAGDRGRRGTWAQARGATTWRLWRYVISSDVYGRCSAFAHRVAQFHAFVIARGPDEGVVRFIWSGDCGTLSLHPCWRNRDVHPCVLTAVDHVNFQAECAIKMRRKVHVERSRVVRPQLDSLGGEALPELNLRGGSRPRLRRSRMTSGLW